MALTRKQITRRGAILARLRRAANCNAGYGHAGRVMTAAQLREYVARHHQIYTTVDTVRYDLHAMEDISGTVRSFHWQGTRPLVWEAV